MSVKCEKKQLTKVDAINILNYNFNHSKSKHKKHRKEIRYYHCPDCNMWHLTSKASGENKVIFFDIIEKERWEKLLINE